MKQSSRSIASWKMLGKKVFQLFGILSSGNAINENNASFVIFISLLAFMSSARTTLSCRKLDGDTFNSRVVKR